MVKSTGVYEGGLRCRMTHGPSGAELLTDAPTDNHGKGEAFSPTDLVVAAAASCMITTMGIVADRKGWDLSGTTWTAEKEMVTEPVRRIGKITVRFTFPRRLDDEQIGVLKRAAGACPVHRSLHPDVVVDVSYGFGEG